MIKHKRGNSCRIGPIGKRDHIEHQTHVFFIVFRNASVGSNQTLGEFWIICRASSLAIRKLNSAFNGTHGLEVFVELLLIHLGQGAAQVAGAAEHAQLRAFAAAAATAGFHDQLLVATDDDATAALAKGELHLAAFTLRLPPPWPSPAGLLKYAALEAVLGAGCGVVFSALTTKWSDAPFAYLYRDADVEAVAAGGRGGGRGRVGSVDDAVMGWSRMAQSLILPPLSPNLFALAATHQSLELVRRLKHHLRDQANSDNKELQQTTAPASEAYPVSYTHLTLPTKG